MKKEKGEFGKEVGQIHKGLLKLRQAGMTNELWQKIVESRGNSLVIKIVGLFQNGDSAGLDYSLILADYEKYFWKVHGLKADFAGIQIPEADDIEFPWFVCRPENFFAERAFSGGAKNNPYLRWKWTNKPLDEVLDVSGRDGWKQPHITRFHDNWEADEELKDLSAEDIAKREINTGCVAEIIILHDFLYWKFGKHIVVLL